MAVHGRECYRARVGAASAPVLRVCHDALVADAMSARPLLDKLGLRPGVRVALLGLVGPAFESFRADLLERAAAVVLGDPGPDTDLVFLAADSPAELEVLPQLRARLGPDAAIWVVSPKGRTRSFDDIEVIAAARAAGLVDTTVVAFSATHTALRLVVPRAARRRPPAR